MKLQTACLLLPLMSTGLFAEPADTVIVDAKVYTANEKQPIAAAIAISNGKISYVGNAQGIEAFIDEQTDVISLPHRLVMPGFIDTHNHVFEGASNVGGNCELSKTASLNQQQHYLERCKKAVKQKGSWVIGYGFQLDALMDGEPSEHPVALLDRHFPDNPVVIMEESSHAMIANTLALKKAGFNSNSAHPSGGRIQFDEQSGQLTGILFDNAGDIVMNIAWKAQKDSFGSSFDGLLAGMEVAAQNGITTIGDGRMYWDRGWFKVWQQALRDKALLMRVSIRPWIYPDMPQQKQLKALKQFYNPNPWSPLVVNQVKMYVDGVLHFGTAKLSKPYKWSWQPDAPKGINYIGPDTLSGWLKNLNRIGYGAHIHAVGDAGITEALDAIASIRSTGGKKRYGLTHLELIRAKDIGRFTKLDVDADFQAGAEFFAQHDWVIPLIGSARAKQLLPMRKVFDTGANVTFSSDWTVNPINPLIAIANSLREKSRQGLPDIDEAIYASTLNGAYALGLEKVTGSIEVGKSADFVVLERDITHAAPAKIEKTEIMMTMYQGVVTHSIP